MSVIDINTLVKSNISNITACEVKSNGSALLFVRNGDAVEQQKIKFSPSILLSEGSLFEEFNDEVELTELAGEHFFNIRATFPDVATYESALKHLKRVTGLNPSSNGAPYKVNSDKVQQCLISNGIRLFNGMKFSDILRMQIDIEVRTTSGFSFPNAERDEDAVIMIAMRDSKGWEKLLSLDEMSEKEMLEEMVKLINERDPDVIEGHNFFNFDLPYLAARAKRYKVKLKAGRDGSVIKARRSRFNVAERTLDYTRFDCFGRHIVDTYHLTQLFDVTTRELDSYGLKAVAKYFGVAAEERTYVAGEDITRIFDEDPEMLKRYAMDDVRETSAISEILSPSYFYQTQLTPISFQNCIVRGNATRIESIFQARYFEDKHSVPLPSMSQQYAGGLSESLESGVFENVWHADVRSLYPSILMANDISPAQDSLGVFREFLGKLREFRLQAKDLMRQAGSEHEREYYRALQGTFKILINSFYGYLGFGYGTFNDFDAAAKVTATGREILTSMVDFIKGEGANVIEMDTDGFYFQPPVSFTGTTDDMQAKIQEILPEGIEVELDATYKTMFGYKAKNYALLRHDGRISLTGAALKSRGLEPFQRRFIHELITLLLEKKPGELPALFDRYKSMIGNRELPLSDFAKSETLSNSLSAYETKMSSGKGRRSAAYELALKAEQEFRQGDQIRYFVTGEKKKVSVVDNSMLFDKRTADEDLKLANTNYYLGKLSELYKKFEAFAEDSNQLSLF